MKAHYMARAIDFLSQPPMSDPPNTDLPINPTPQRKPNRQREHQANERTFLAWLRTSISLIGFGFAIARFGLFIQQLENLNTTNSSAAPFFSSRLIGISLVGFGVLSITLAAWRYNQAFLQIENGRYRPNRWAIWLLTAMVTLLGVLCIPLLL